MAKTKNYKKKWSGWRKYRTTCSAEVHGKVYNGNCGEPQDFNSLPKSGRRKKIKSHKSFNYYAQGKKDGSILSHHYGAGGISYYNALD